MTAWLLVAFEWRTYLAGVVSALLLVAAILAALGQIGGAVQSVRQRVWPGPPIRVKFASRGGTLGSAVLGGRRVWNNVLPDFVVRNDGPSALYDVEAGALDPRGAGARLTHPGRVHRLAGEGDRHRFGSSEQFKIPAEWLDGYEGREPQKQIPYFVAATDEAGRRWEAKCHADPADDWVPLKFRAT